MKTINNTSSFTVLGVKFKNIHEVIAYSVFGIAQESVYVGKDCKRYPCFDAEDYASEDRFYWNFVFAKSQEELETRLANLKKISPEGNYCKFSEALAPMAYWSGDSFYDVTITDDID